MLLLGHGKYIATARITVKVSEKKLEVENCHNLNFRIVDSQKLYFYTAKLKTLSMKLPRYELIAEKSMMVFEFTSEGQNGHIPKLIKFSPTTIEEVYRILLLEIKTLTLAILTINRLMEIANKS